MFRYADLRAQFISIHINSIASSVQVFRPAFGLHTRDSPLWDKAENREGHIADFSEGTAKGTAKGSKMLKAP